MKKAEERKFILKEGRETFTPRGVLPRDASMRMVLSPPDGAEVVKAVLRIHGDGEGSMHLTDMERADGDFETVISPESICAANADGLFYYCYDVYYPDGCVTFGGESPSHLYPCGEDGKRQLLVTRTDITTPQWLTGGIMYHIFVDRFRASGRARAKPGTVINPDWKNGIPQFAKERGDDLPNNVFFGGDLYGIAEKMDYIASLGVTCLYLSPIFDGASNHKYDTGDYSRIDEMFGGEEGFDRVIEAAHARGIRVILDGVFNHTGADSVYFNKFGHYDSVGAYQAKESPYFDWYYFHEYPDGYESWWGMPTLPKVRCDETSYREYILGENGIMAKWMRKGADGWRLDVADELTDGFLDALSERVKRENPEAVVYGEVWEDATNKCAYGQRRRYLRGGQLDSVMNYPLREAVIAYVRYGDAEKFRAITEGLYRRYPKGASDLLMNVLGTHDTARILTVLAGDHADGYTNTKLSVKRLTDVQRAHGVVLLRIAYAIVSVMPGVPCIFYGDEAGIEGYGDPFCRMPFPWGREDEEILSAYREIGQLRRGEPVLADGEMRILAATPDLLAVIRENGRDRAVLLIVNRSQDEITCRLSAAVENIAKGGKPTDTPAIPPLSAVWFHAADGIEMK